jgi:hypothetical protein
MPIKDFLKSDLIFSYLIFFLGVMVIVFEMIF